MQRILTSRLFALALLCTAALLSSLPAAHTQAQQMPALPTGVRLVLARCDGIVDRKSLLDQLRIELLSIGVVDIDIVDPETGQTTRNASNADRIATLHVYFPECDDDAGLVNLRISDRLTAKYTERALVVSDVIENARPRAVALAIVELLRASWLELVIQPQDDNRGVASNEVRSRLVTHLKEQTVDENEDRKSPEQRAREIDAARAALDEAARDERWDKKRLEWLAGSRLFPEGDAGDVSTTISMSLALNRRMRLQVGAVAAGGGVNNRDIDVHTFEGAGRLGLSLAGGSDPEIEIIPSVEVGWARLTSPDAADISRVLALGSMNATIRTSITKGVDGLLGVQSGYVFTPVELKSKGQSLGGMMGPVIGVNIGLAGIL